MAATPANALDLTSTSAGLVTWDGTKVAGTSTPTNHAIMVGTGSNSITSVGPGSTGQVLQANSSADPTYSTATYPSTTTANQILYSSATNTVGQITAVNSASLVTSSAGVPSLAAMTSGQLIIGNTGGTPTAAVPTSTGGNFITGTGSLKYIPANYQPAVSNLSIAYAAGTFTVQGFDGTALSATNPAYVTLQSPSTAGQLITVSVTANQTFTDSAGSNQISGNNFGVTAGVAWATDMPYFLYAVVKSDGTAIAFMISRHPAIKVSPVAGKIGQSGSSLATTQASFFSLAAITAANYASQPCLCIGSFRMQKATTSNTWTVSAISAQDGIGSFMENLTFTYPAAQNGASTGTLFTANGGTAPVFTTNSVGYKINRFGFCETEYFLSGDGGTDGAGAVSAQLTLPYTGSVMNQTNNCPTGNALILSSIGTGGIGVVPTVVDANPFCTLTSFAGSDTTNGNFSNGARYVQGRVNFLITNV